MYSRVSLLSLASNKQAKIQILKRLYSTSLTSTTSSSPSSSLSVPHVKFEPKLMRDGAVIFHHSMVRPVEADLANIRSTATNLTEEQKQLIRKMRLEDPLKNNASQLSKYFGVSRATILKVAPLSESVRLKIFGIPTIPSGEGKKKPDVEKWKAMVQRKEKDNIKEVKKFHKAMLKEDLKMQHAAAKDIERGEIQRQYSREKTAADDKALVQRGLLKGGVLKANQFIRADNKGKKK